METPLGPILAHLKSEPSRTWSIVITLFGDAIMPRGGEIWLGTLLEILGAMDIGGGVVRTAMSRLATDGWLQRSRIGRNSFYRITEKGGTSFAAAATRIYGQPPQHWDGGFHLLLNAPNQDTTRAALRHAGFGSIPPGVWIAPLSTPVPRQAAALTYLRSHTDLATGRHLAEQAWNLTHTADAYRRFVDVFATLRTWVLDREPMAHLDALVARTLLIHEYRRIVLRDPLLPPALLPAPWPGTTARQLCAEVYRALAAGSERWLDQHAQTETGALPPPLIAIPARFNVLQKTVDHP